MTQDQLREALGELNGERDVRICFASTHDMLYVANALLIPEEPDGVVKLSDGKKVFLIDSARVAYIEIG